MTRAGKNLKNLFCLFVEKIFDTTPTPHVSVLKLLFSISNNLLVKITIDQ